VTEFWSPTMMLPQLRMNWFWADNVLQNVLPFLVIIAAAWTILGSRRQPLWAEAYRRLGRNRLALGAVVVIGLYAAVALLDSVGWREDRNARWRSVIDRVAERPAERTYSAPMARWTTGEPKPQPLQAAHLLGTDGIGQDVLYRTLKGARTAFIIGGLTWLIVTPLALTFGLLAGYFGRRVDDAVQYLYTTLDSIPSILLLIAMMMAMGRGLIQMSIALGVTSWVYLCRVVRGETLKHRDREYVRAARALGVGHARILGRHILPNLLPIVIISITLGVSNLILSEAILSYLQLGVPGNVGSWGNMIDAARLELSREPAIWWNLVSASAALFFLVLAFNVFGDALRDALDPRLRSA
jgi:peptide/nickel transport system permease protein